MKPYGLTFQRLEPRQLLSVSTGSSWPKFDPTAPVAAEDLLQESTARDYLKAQSETAYLQGSNTDLRLIEVKHGLASTTTRFQQTYNGIPVHGAFVTLNQGPDGEFQQLFDQGFDSLSTVNKIGAQISLDMAESFAIVGVGVHADVRRQCWRTCLGR